MKAWKIGFVAMMAAILMIVTSCSSGKPPKEAVVSAISKMADLQSYTMHGSFGFDEVEIPASIAGDADEALGINTVVSMLKGATIDVKGTFQAEPLRSDMVLDIKLGSEDSSFNLAVPVIVTEDKVWLKIPAIPGVPIPPAISGKFVEFDLKKIAEMQEEADAAVPDTEQLKKLGQEVLSIVLNGFDEKTYFSEPKAADVKGIPDGLKADQIVRFAITSDNLDQTITTVLNDVIPQVLDLFIKNDEYQKMLQLTPEELEEAKTELASLEEGEFKEGLEELKKSLTINELSTTAAIKNGYVNYQDARANIELHQDGETMKFGVHFSTTYDNINKEVKFENELPTDALPIDELIGGMMGGGGQIGLGL